jgi:hypothetical protein
MGKSSSGILHCTCTFLIWTGPAPVGFTVLLQESDEVHLAIVFGFPVQLQKICPLHLLAIPATSWEWHD